MKKRKNAIRIIALVLAILMLLSMIAQVITAQSSWTEDVFAYGAGLSDSQVQSTAVFLEVSNEETPRIIIKGEDAQKYLNEPSSDASMISSVYIKKNNDNKINVEVVTPLTIQSVSSLQYANAAVTAGVNGLDIKVGSVVPVTGTSALTGVYKALENIGVKLDTDRTEAANKEIEIINEITENNKDKEGFTKEKLNEAVLEGKKQIVEIKDSNGVVVADDVKNVVQNVLTNSNLNQVINNVDIENLTLIFNNFVNITNNNTFNIGEVKVQLQSIADNAGELAKKELEKVQQFLQTDQGKAYLESIKDKLNPEQLKGLLESGKNALSSSQIEDALNSIKENISPDKLNDLVNSAKNAFSINSETVENVKEQATSFFGFIRNFFSRIVSFFKGLTN